MSVNNLDKISLKYLLIKFAWASRRCQIQKALTVKAYNIIRNLSQFWPIFKPQYSGTPHLSKLII